jgi:hypothetical protein
MKLFSACVLMLSTAGAMAQVGRSFTAVEAYVARGKVVYVGRISKLELIEYTEPLTGSQVYGKPYRVTFDVSEVIRGPKRSIFHFILALQSTPDLQYMLDHRLEIMLVAGPNRIDSVPSPEVGIEEEGVPVHDYWYHFRILDPLPESKPGERTVLDQLGTNYDSGRMFTYDLKIVKGREQILSRARVFAKRYPDPLPAVWLYVPNDFAALVGYPNAYCMITLPVCAETNQVILELVRHPERMAARMKVEDRKKHLGEIQANAIRALRPFPNAEGRSVLERIVKGRGSADVREEARRVLAEWRVGV